MDEEILIGVYIYSGIKDEDRRGTDILSQEEALEEYCNQQNYTNLVRIITFILHMNL